jgi:hypothetical protein
MQTTNAKIELIIDTAAFPTKGKPLSKSKNDFVKRLKSDGIKLQLSDFAPAKKTKTKGPLPAASKKLIAKTNVSSADVNPWDLAHMVNDQIKTNASFVEPDLASEFIVDSKVHGGMKNVKKAILKSSGNPEDFDSDWNPQENSIWHLGNKFSQLFDARNDAIKNDDGYVVRIGHLDTGYSSHPQNPPKLNKKLQRNFVEGEDPNDATDKKISGTLKMPGHGTGTICILAGGNFKTPDGKFNDALGGAPFAEVIPCRISNSVVLFKASNFAKALQYLIDLNNSGTRVHAVSMSMGGVPSQLWADTINAAYEAGIVVVTAAGNNFNGLPTRKLIYPARFNRVIAACGVTHDHSPYYHKKIGEMQGNWGPKKNMGKALAAFTPNTPWALMNRKTVSFSGAGTSSATPQIAAAAACYYKKYHKELDAMEPWMRVEAIRHALYKTALKKVKNADDDYSVYFGNGILQAADALKVPVKTSGLVKSEKDDIPFLPLLSILFKSKAPVVSQEMKMFNVELAQLVMTNEDLAKLMYNEEKDFVKLPAKRKSQFLDAVVAKKEASKKLKEFIKMNKKKIVAARK